MLYNLYLKKGTVYLPTVVNQGIAVYMDVEPVTVVPRCGYRRLTPRVAKHDPQRKCLPPPSLEDSRKPPVILKYTDDKSWSAFSRSASAWSIYEKNGIYRIAPYRTHQKGYWEEDPEREMRIPPRTPINDVVERMIAILQDAARP